MNAFSPPFPNWIVPTPPAGDSSHRIADTEFVGAAISAATREKLTAARTYFVRSDGSDSNTGLVNSAGGAFLTWAAAVAVFTNTLDFGGQVVTVTNGNAATYTNGISMTSAWAGGGSIVFDIGGGTLNVASNCLSVFNFSMPGQITIQNGTLSGGNAISHAAIGVIQLGTNLTFGTCTGRHLFIQIAGAQISAVGVSYSISGGAINHMYPTNGGLMFCALVTGAISTNVTFDATSGFAFADHGGVISAGLGTYTVGAFTVVGRRYNVASNAVIDTLSGGANYFPGNAAGTSNTGGQYI